MLFCTDNNIQTFFILPDREDWPFSPPPLPTNKVIINKINTKGKLLEHQVKFELIEAVCSPYIILNYVREKNDGVLDMQARKKGKELWSNG